YTLAATHFIKQQATIAKNSVCLSKEPFCQVPLAVQRYILRRVVNSVGGKTYPPNAQELTRACQKIASSEDICFTLGRTLIKQRKKTLHIVREERNMPPAVPLPPQRLICWDGRFWFHNTTEEPYWIVAPKGRTDPYFYKDPHVCLERPTGVVCVSSAVENIVKDW
ncbi:MAG: hypothetical protein LBQ26_01140, partial [Holosporales bacterium]|nr:hypothetical protein [Holosporales bacterium]